MFSPYYRHALRRGGAIAEDHCAINVALYGRGGHRWTMTERGRRHVQRGARHFAVGPSALQWQGDALTIDIDEVGAPLPRRLRGRVTVRPQGLNGTLWSLDDLGRHRWGPIAPSARVELQLDRPALAWNGHGYFDANDGDEPVDRPFRSWDWARGTLADGRTAVVYDVRQKHGPDRLLALRFGVDGHGEAFEPPPRERLPLSAWGIRRQVLAENSVARVRSTLEDTPFYVRSVLDTRLCGEPVVAMHETLHVPRLTSLPVQCMLPVRMPRVR